MMRYGLSVIVSWLRSLVRLRGSFRPAGSLLVLVVGVAQGQSSLALAAPPQQSPALPIERTTDLSPQALRKLFGASLQLGTRFLLHSQLPTGNFRYHVNFLTGETAQEQNAVRQAGALWGLSLLHHDQPSKATREAVLRGIDFFARHSQLNDRQQRFIRYPGMLEGDSGAVALVTLALIDFLRSEQGPDYPELVVQRDQYLSFLLSLRRSDNRFHARYLHTSGEGWGQGSPYFDGEILLALAKAVRYAGKQQWSEQCFQSAEAMYQRYAETAVSDHLDSDTTKGFFQWGCMAFVELQGVDSVAARPFADRTVELGHWMIDTHEVQQRRLNTAYALEGIACAYHLAQQIDDQAAAKKFYSIVVQELMRLTSWQVGGPRPNEYLQSAKEYDVSCRGGILSARDHPWLRIDTTQHQMHALILARRYVCSEP